MADHDRSSRAESKSKCLNCGQSLRGDYCSFCGQAARSPIRPFVEFVQESLSEAVSLDGAQLRSLLVLVTRPGQLTVDYIEGRRARFVHPVRIFLGVGIAAYLITRLVPTGPQLFGVGPELFGDDSSAIEVLGAAALIPLGAAAHWLAFRMRRPMLLEHFVFVIHLAAFSFLLAPIEGMLYVFTEARPVVATAITLMPPIVWGIYWVLALGRLNQRTLRRSVVDAFRVYLALILIVSPLIAYQIITDVWGA